MGQWRMLTGELGLILDRYNKGRVYYYTPYFAGQGYASSEGTSDIQNFKKPIDGRNMASSGIVRKLLKSSLRSYWNSIIRSNLEWIGDIGSIAPFCCSACMYDPGLNAADFQFEGVVRHGTSKRKHGGFHVQDRGNSATTKKHLT